MRKLLIFLTFSTLTFYSNAQLSLHLGAYGSSPAGLNMPPYDLAFFDVPFLAGGEVGYRIVERFAVFGFVYAGNSGKEYFIRSGNIEANSSFLHWGIRPQFNLVTSSSGVFNFDIGMPLSFVSQELEWSDNGTWFFSNSQFSAGRDDARFFRAGVAPTLRYFFEEPRLTLQVGFNLNYDQLMSASRQMTEPASAEDGFDDSAIRYHVVNLGINVTFGYSFW